MHTDELFSQLEQLRLELIQLSAENKTGRNQYERKLRHFFDLTARIARALKDGESKFDLKARIARILKHGDSKPDELNEHLKILIDQACQLSRDKEKKIRENTLRRQIISHAILLIQESKKLFVFRSKKSGKLFDFFVNLSAKNKANKIPLDKDEEDVYAEAVCKVQEYFLKNYDKYDPDNHKDAQVITWLSHRLKFEVTTQFHKSNPKRLGISDRNTLDDLARCCGCSVEEMQTVLAKWVQDKPRLKTTFLEGHPSITVEWVIRNKFMRGETLDDLALTAQIELDVLKQFFRQKVKNRLTYFLKQKYGVTLFQDDAYEESYDTTSSNEVSDAVRTEYIRQKISIWIDSNQALEKEYSGVTLSELLRTFYFLDMKWNDVVQIFAARQKSGMSLSEVLSIFFPIYQLNFNKNEKNIDLWSKIAKELNIKPLSEEEVISARSTYSSIYRRYCRRELIKFLEDEFHLLHDIN